MDFFGQMNKIERLDEKKLAVIIALTDGESVAAAAKLTDVSRQAIYNWIADDYMFQRALNKRLLGITYIKIMKSLPHVEEAIDTIVEIMHDENIKPATRLAAANSILAISHRNAEYSINADLGELRKNLEQENAE